MKNIIKKIIYKINNPILSDLKKFENIHNGEDCYIIGDGVSLKWFDLKNFSNLKTIVSGKLFYHNDFNLINAKYSILTDPFFLSPIFLMLKKKYGKNYEETKNKIILRSDPIAIQYQKFIQQYKNIEFFVNLSNFLFLKKANNINYVFENIPYLDNDLSLLNNKISVMGSTCRLAIFLAIFLGFKKIYLIGFDYTHYPSRENHWFEKGRGLLDTTNKHQNYEKDFFNLAKEYSYITSITLDGSSNYINSTTYEKFTNTKPIFQENHNLVSKKYMQILSSSKWFGYNIY